MAVMVIIFFILISVSVAALAITANQQNVLLRKLWMSLSNHTKEEVQKFGNCCGFENKNITLGNEGHPSCEKVTVVNNLFFLGIQEMQNMQYQKPRERNINFAY